MPEEATLSMNEKSGFLTGLPVMWWIKFILLFIIVTTSVAFTVPTFLGDRSTWPNENKGQDISLLDPDEIVYTHWYHQLAASVLPNKAISLGLDLQGGLHLVLEVDAEKSLRDSVTRAMIRARDQVASKGIKITDVKVADDFYASATIDKPASAEEFRAAVQSQSLLIVFRNVEGNTVHFAPHASNIAEERTRVLEQAISTIRNRVDQFAVSEPNIFQHGENRVVVQLPGVKEPERAKSLLGNTARLDFRLVLDGQDERSLRALLKEARDALKLGANDVSQESMQQITQWLQDQNKIKNNETILLERKFTMVSGKKVLEDAVPYLVEANAQLTGDQIEQAVASDQGNTGLPEPHVVMQFKPQGAKLFGELTTKAYNKDGSTGHIAIILDGNIQSAPIVNQGPILGGSASISMGMGSYEEQMQEARDLALVLRAGALPATIRIIEERQVGPSEGEENIRAGVISCVVATILVVMFMWYVYGNSGIVANFALVLNGLIVLAFLAMFGATLTLPGIAGITLTMAMAVDGNIIINERIREEYRIGLPARQAFYKGYASAYSTVVDANLTTAMAGVILLIYGSPAIRGFAVTLLVGIVSTMYTAYFATEVVGQWLVEKTRIKRFS